MLVLALGLLTSLLKQPVVWALMVVAGACEFSPRRIRAILFVCLMSATLMGTLKRLELEAEGFPPESGRQLAVGAAVLLLVLTSWAATAMCRSIVRRVLRYHYE